MMELFERSRLGQHELKNRIFRSATNEHLGYADGCCSDALIDVYTELARGGVGTIITGHYCVQENTRVDELQPYALPANAPGMERAAAAVHEADPEVKLILQLSHGGMKASEAVNRRPSRKPADYSVEELQEIRTAFLEAALLAQRCGFDGVQVHMAHGYFLSNMLDPGENLRTDSYGSAGMDPDSEEAVENRFRLAGEILRDIRQQCKDSFLILVKVNSDCTVAQENGNSFVPAPRILHRVLDLCSKTGVDAAEISGLAFASQKAAKDEPYFLKETLEAGAGLELPVILVGGLDSREKMQRVLDAGIPYVSLSRSLICQPDFVHRLEAGIQEKSICLRCFGCFRCYRQRHVRCVLHREKHPQLEKMYVQEDNVGKNSGVCKVCVKNT